MHRRAARTGLIVKAHAPAQHCPAIRLTPRFCADPGASVPRAIENPHKSCANPIQYTLAYHGIPSQIAPPMVQPVDLCGPLG